MSRIRALVIDDDPRIHRQVEEALCPQIVGTVQSSVKSSDGIRMALADPPDVILLDVNIPVMDGFKVCRLLKDNVCTHDVPIIFITVDKNVVHLARALDCGAADWISKPVNPIELKARVRVGSYPHARRPPAARSRSLQTGARRTRPRRWRRAATRGGRRDSQVLPPLRHAVPLWW
jgi:DNA-binding response OmpR family regulator